MLREIQKDIGQGNTTPAVLTPLSCFHLAGKREHTALMDATTSSIGA